MSSQLALAVRGALLVSGCATVEVLACRLASTAALPALAALDAGAPLGVQGVGTIVTALAAVLLLLAWSWLTCATVLIVGGVLQRSPRPGRLRLRVPAGWQRVVVALLGAGALCIPAAVLAADGSGRAPDGPGPAAARIDGLPLPDRPRGVGAGTRGPALHRVAQGQSLWTIARGHMEANATAEQVAAQWPRWYAANAAAIGDDPDLITPGTLLRAPGQHVPRPQNDHLAAGTDPARTDGGRR